MSAPFSSSAQAKLWGQEKAKDARTGCAMYVHPKEAHCISSAHSVECG